MVTLTKIKNTTNKIYNGFKPDTILNVENPERYLLEGWSKVDETQSEQVEEKKEASYAELVEKATQLGINTKGKKKELLIAEIEKAEAEKSEANEDVEDEDLEDELE